MTITSRLNNMLEALGLTKVADAIAGNNVLRGISGVPRSRMAVGKMLMSSKTKFLCLENFTNGLTPSDAMELMKLMKFITRLCKTKSMSTMVTLQQPSNEISWLHGHRK